ncbi:hypothetical protein O181_057755 [Austropuccinia psidii MF-1]|uniref:Uncharacterized protein n=1 Tax=Austropuccinia psidii MF-1 TaxID=1389203 RepID=A0A9Q3E8E9_9BASI|nr:hypothetical protein [Austropuccinia psidii MF-1]
MTIINPTVISKGKLGKAVDSKFVQGPVKETLSSKGTNQRTEKACPEPEGLEEGTLDTVVDGLEGYGSSSSAPPTPQRPFEWSMHNKRFNLASHWAELEASFQKICLKEIDFKDLMVITKGWNPTRQIRLLEMRANRRRENQATLQAIEEQLTQTGHTQIPSASQGLGQTSSPVASHPSGTTRSVSKSHHSTQSQEFSRKRQGYKGKNKTSFNKRQRESYAMMQKLLDLVKEVLKNQK